MKTVLALGFFDSIHTGHRRLIADAKTLAEALGAELCVSTFDDSFFELLTGGEVKEIYSLDERRKLLSELGVSCVRVFDSTTERFSQSGKDFFNELISGRDIAAVFCGEDYTFGYKASCACNDLKLFCEKEGILFKVAKTVTDGDGSKVSSSIIRKLLAAGDIPEANRLLGRDYFCAGTVVHGRGDGRKFGIPTANLGVLREKLLPAYGVYQTVTDADGMRYHSLTNVGAQPTFDLDKPTIETLILDYSGNLYGKEITISFVRKLRDIVRFPNARALKQQIDHDMTEAKRD